MPDSGSFPASEGKGSLTFIKCRWKIFNCSWSPGARASGGGLQRDLARNASRERLQSIVQTRPLDVWGHSLSEVTHLCTTFSSIPGSTHYFVSELGAPLPPFPPSMASCNQMSQTLASATRVTSQGENYCSEERRAQPYSQLLSSQSLPSDNARPVHIPAAQRSSGVRVS